MKTIEYTLTLGGIDPADVQAGGVQGDHCATALLFCISQELWQDINKDVPSGHNIRCHVETSDGTGGAHASDLLELATPPSGTTVPDNTARMITYTIPKEITLAGGVAQFFLVISDVDNESLSSRTLYSFPARVRFDASVAGTTSADNYYGDVNGALDALLKALQEFRDTFPIGTEDIQDAAVTTAKLADSAVTTAKLGTGTVTADKLGTAAVTSAKIVAGAVTSDKLESGAVTEAKIADGAVTHEKLGQNAVDTENLQDDSVSGEKLQGWPGKVISESAMNTTTTPGIYGIDTGGVLFVQHLDEDNSVMQTWIDGIAVKQRWASNPSTPEWASWYYIGFPLTGANIADGSITTAKLADGAVASAKIGASSVTAEKLAVNSVTADKLSGFPATHLDSDNIDNTVSGGMYITPNGTLAFVYGLTSSTGASAGMAQIKIESSGTVSYRSKAMPGDAWPSWAALGNFLPYQDDQTDPDTLTTPGLYAIGANKYLVIPHNDSRVTLCQIRITTQTGGNISFAYRYNDTWSGDDAWYDWQELGDIPDASTTQAGKVMLNNTLTSTSTTEALTAAQGKALKDMIDDLPSGSGDGGLPFSSQYNFNIDEITEDCIRVVGGTTTGTKPPCNNYALVTTFSPRNANGYTDGGYMLQMAQSDNGKLYTRYNYSTPPNWSAWQTGSN